MTFEFGDYCESSNIVGEVYAPHQTNVSDSFHPWVRAQPFELFGENRLEVSYMGEKSFALDDLKVLQSDSSHCRVA